MNAVGSAAVPVSETLFSSDRCKTGVGSEPYLLKPSSSDAVTGDRHGIIPQSDSACALRLRRVGLVRSRGCERCARLSRTRHGIERRPARYGSAMALPRSWSAPD